MVDVFISYSRKDKTAVAQLARKIEAEGYKVWWDAELPPHKSYGEVITAKIEGAKAALVVWSPEAAKSEWVRAEADMARNSKKLIQTALGDIQPPLPFNQIQFADIGDWQGEDDHNGWSKVKESLRDLCGERDSAAVGSGAAASVAATPATAPAAAPTPVPEVVPIQSFAAPTGGSAPQTQASASKWPLFAGLGIGGAALLVAGAFVFGSQLSDSDAAETPPPSIGGGAADKPADDAGTAQPATPTAEPADPTADPSNPKPGPSNPTAGPPAPPQGPGPTLQPTVPSGPQVFGGALNNGQTATHFVNFNANVSYTISANCDQDCSDIDMWLYDENGNLVSEDVLEDDFPVVNVTPVRGAQFRLELSMFACSIEPCSYEIVAEAN